MFDKLRSALKGFAASIKEAVEKKELSEKDLETPLEELMINLVEADVAYDVAESIVMELRTKLIGSKVPRGINVEDYVLNSLKSYIATLFSNGIDLVSEAKRKCSSGLPYVITFFGVNGVGKTTTIAKVAYMLKSSGLTPVIAAADTFRAGAQEQLRTHAERLGVAFIGGSYGADPASVAYNAINYAKNRRVCAVLIDTAGRMHVDADLMSELKKIVRVANPDLRVLVVDSLTGNDAVEQAKSFNENVGIDAIILTKLDADLKGGVAISVAATTKKPVIYVGVGQNYSDLRPFSPNYIISAIFGN
ncbi:Probable signal recognition particle protein [Acidilobus saccharovorans 345-15]|uniref:Signal recognition particle receptor FtsY n=1 Tax=Acidilobus saccharovorans (strain DSM 16705 / JCM 18335 / VKM B-2471 / 345-15) TaxID=666510 RepID=D9Q2I0_ACIS3|nr:signal recognition particle-docking protein FtsY [Acidilobus saccharovorans]ADL19518.1 Probable signal recognition particle protein [Acidilobus saccharovorans 345-15]